MASIAKVYLLVLLACFGAARLSHSEWRYGCSKVPISCGSRAHPFEWRRRLAIGCNPSIQLRLIRLRGGIVEPRLETGNTTTSPSTIPNTSQTRSMGISDPSAMVVPATEAMASSDVDKIPSSISSSQHALLLVRARILGAASLMQIRTQEAIAGRQSRNITSLLPYMRHITQLFQDTAFPLSSSADAQDIAMSQLRLVIPFRPLELSNATFVALSREDRTALELELRTNLISIIAPVFLKPFGALQSALYSNFESGMREMIESGHYSEKSARSYISSVLQGFDANTYKIREVIWEMIMNVSIPSPPRSAPIASTFFDWLSTRWRHRLAHKIGASNSCLSSDQLAALSAELDDALRVRLSRSRLNQALTQRFEDLHTQMVANGMCNPYTRGSLLPPTSLTLNWVFRPDYLASRIADVVSNKRDTATTSIVGGRGVRPILPQAFRYSEKSNKL